jgi:heme A synthase
MGIFVATVSHDSPVSHAFRGEPVNANYWIRQVHRWVAIVFTVAVMANFAAMTQGEPPAWVTYSPLLPLALLLFTGLYLFALPYVVRWRRTGGSE